MAIRQKSDAEQTISEQLCAFASKTRAAEFEIDNLYSSDSCNSLERTENSILNLPVIRLPVVQCTSKVVGLLRFPIHFNQTGTGIFGSIREHVCSSNFCHMMRTEVSLFPKPRVECI